MELRSYISLLRRWLWLILLLAILGAGIAFTISKLTTPVYKATTTLLINQAPASSSAVVQDVNSLTTSGLLAKTYKELLHKRPVLIKVIETLKLSMTVEELDKNITVDIVRDTQLLTLSVEDTDPLRASLIANALAKEFSQQNQNLQAARYTTTKQSLQDELTNLQTEIIKAQAALDVIKTPSNPDQQAEQTRLQTALAQYRTSYANLLKSFEDVRLAEAQATSNVSVVEEAIAPTNPVRPNTILNTLLAAVIGLLVAIGIAFLVEYLDDSIKTSEQTEQLVGATTLGVISRIKGNNIPSKLITLTHPNSPISEGYRVLRANIEFSEVDNIIRTLLITSSSAGEGKSTTAINLVIAFAQMGKRVILVDSDLRRPSLHKYFQKSNASGLTNVLLEQKADLSDYLLDTSVPNLRLLLSGPLPPNPAELLSSNRMQHLIGELKSVSDIVLFDSSPVLPVIDPTLLAKNCDATLVIINSGDTRSGALKKAYVQLQQSGTRMLGVVLNRVSASHSTYNYYFRYDYTSADNRKKGVFGWIGRNRNRSVSGDSSVASNFAADGSADSIGTVITANLPDKHGSEKSNPLG